MNVRDVMTRSVVAVRTETPLKEVARLLVRHGISGLPVVGPDGAILGVVSEADFLIKEQGQPPLRHRWLRALLGEADATREQIAKVEATTAGAAMTRPAITIEADRPVHEAAELMVTEAVNRLPVTSKGHLVGIVTRADIVRAFLRTDEELVQAISEDAIRRTMWLDPADFAIDVREGVARVAGRVERRSDAAVLERVIAMIPGIVGVECRISWQLDDRDIQAPERDFISPFTPSRR
jgi:CBS domain-containing protein